MKRSTLWSTVWAVLVVLCGWQWVEGRVRPPPTPLPPLEIGPSDAGHEVLLQPGQRLSIGLPLASASGYQCWIQDPAAQVLELEQEPARAVHSRRWLMRAARSGTGRLRFDCHYELSAQPPRRFEYSVRVR